MLRKVPTILALLALCVAVTVSATENYPRLSVFEAHYTDPPVMKAPADDWIFEGTEGDLVILDFPPATTVWFTWVAAADHYGGTIVGYRSSSDDPFEPDYLGTTLGPYYYGTRLFSIEVIDDAGNISRGEFRINVSDLLPVRQSTWGAIKALYR